MIKLFALHWAKEAKKRVLERRKDDRVAEQNGKITDKSGQKRETKREKVMDEFHGSRDSGRCLEAGG